MSGKFHENSTHSLSDAIAEIIRSRILQGEYEIGEKIKENRIAEEMKVSRTPIREAFKQLEQEGLIDYIPNRGCFAKGFTMRDIEDIYAVRRALEIMAVEWAVKNITPDETCALEDQLKQMEFYANEKNLEKVIETSEAFQEIIYHASGSRFLTQVLHSYKSYLEKTKKQVLEYGEDKLIEILKEYRDIFSCIEKRDLDGAIAGIERHLDQSYQRVAVSYHQNI